MTDRLTPRYSIIFNGELLDSTSREKVLETLSKLTNTPSEDLLDSLFSVKPVIVTQIDEQELADQYVTRYRQAGLDVSLHPYEQTHDDIINAELSFGHYAPLETQQSAPNYVFDNLEVTPEELQEIAVSGRYLVVFEGQLRDKVDNRDVVKNLCALTNATEQQILEEVFSVVPVIICQTDDMALAQFYHECYFKAGLHTETFDNHTADSDIQTRSKLTIRDDKPQLLAEKSIQQFTYTLLGLSVVAILIWAVIYATYDSFFSSSRDQVIDVQLNRYQPAPPAKQKPKITSVNDKVIAAKPAKPEKIEKTKPTPSKPELSKPAQQQVLNQTETVTNKLNKKQRQGIKDDYYLQLLSWFARYQQSQAGESKNLEGEIKLRVTILRNGKVKKVEVLSSSSQKLSYVIQQQAYAASPFPVIPEQLGGSDYRFDLPLRYRLEKQP